MNALGMIGGSLELRIKFRGAAKPPFLFFLASFASKSAAERETTPQKYLQTLVKINYEAGSDRRELKVATKGSDRRGDVLSAMRSFLKEMNEPQSRFPVVQVVGSKGKGSTSALLTSILRQAGLRVGTYTR